MSVWGPELYDRKPVEPTPPIALAQLVPCLVRERGYQFPTFSDVVEERNDLGIKARVIPELGHLIARHADCVRPTFKERRLPADWIRFYIVLYRQVSEGPAVSLYTQVPFGPADAPTYPQRPACRGRRNRSHRTDVCRQFVALRV